MSRRFAFVRRPRPAWVDVGSPYPARLLLELHSHALNHGMPATRSGGAALAWVGRRGLPVRPAAAVARRLPARPIPEVDLLLEEVTQSWGELAASSDRLPTHAPSLSALVIQRASGRYFFVFGDSRHPMLLLKPGPSDGVQDPEEEALRAAADAGIAPRQLPPVATMSVQEGLPGRPLWVLAPRGSGWSRDYVAAYDALGAGLVRLTESTAHRGPNDLDHYLALAASHVRSTATATLVDAARRDLRSMHAVSLQHRDLSAQNWLVDGPSFVGLVDWETAHPGGVPGHDALQAAVALLEHGVALNRWSQTEVVRSFHLAWIDEPLFSAARSWHRECVLAATGSDRLAEPLMVAFFARRLGRRISGGGPETLSVSTLAAMLEVVTGSAVF
ncbi:hypothetical protein GCM10027020_03870 [Nocardioides salsibiostraticola]